MEIVGFDLDGTLVDSSGDLAKATNAALANIGRAGLTREQVLPFIGLGPRHMLEQALLATGGAIPGARFDALFEDLLGYYECHIAVCTRLYPGALELFDQLDRAKIKFGVVTNKPEHLASKLLAELAILDRLSFVIGGDSLGPGKAKPSGEPILEMVKRCGGGHALFVGDSVHDIAAARNAGVASILLRQGRADSELHDLCADLTLDDLEALASEFTAARPPR